MEENLKIPSETQPVQSAQPIMVSEPVQPVGKTADNKTSPKIRSKTKNFLTGLFFGLAGAIVLALLDLLFIAKANPTQDTLIWFLVILGPVLILGLYTFFLTYFFKKQKFIFLGLLSSFFIFIVLSVIVIKFVMVP